MNQLEDAREQALKKLETFEVLMRDGHFDYHNGFHGRVYLNPHQLFRHPSTIWRLAQDLLDVLPPHLLEPTDIVAGPATGGALLAHTMAGLLDGRRALTHPACSFAPFTPGAGKFALRSFYAQLIRGKRVLLADDVRNTGKTFQRCAELVSEAGGTVLATVEILRPLRSHRRPRRAELRARRVPRAPRTIPRPSVRCARRGSRLLRFRAFGSRLLAPGRTRNAYSKISLEPKAQSLKPCARFRPSPPPSMRSIATTTARSRRAIPCTASGPSPIRGDREIAGFCAAALAFGRVASVLNTIDTLFAIMGPRPAEYVRQFDPRGSHPELRAMVHRWTRGVDIAALLWVLRQMLESSGSIEDVLSRRG